MIVPELNISRALKMEAVNHLELPPPASRDGNPDLGRCSDVDRGEGCLPQQVICNSCLGAPLIKGDREIDGGLWEAFRGHSH